MDLTTFESLEEEYMSTVNKEREEEHYSAVIPTFEDGFMYRCVRVCVCVVAVVVVVVRLA